MKHILTGFSLISAWALLALAVGCASTSTQTQSEQDLLIAAGFKAVAAKTTGAAAEAAVPSAWTAGYDYQRWADLLRVSRRG